MVNRSIYEDIDRCDELDALSHLHMPIFELHLSCIELYKIPRFDFVITAVRIITVASCLVLKISIPLRTRNLEYLSSVNLPDPSTPWALSVQNVKLQNK
uniref:Uncharacterized protein n=1 Tax=Onchocerca volvulus TaxID=6282 RepID=A0A8R1TVE9_ONCVO